MPSPSKSSLKAIRLVGICAIMFTENWRMALRSPWSRPIYWNVRRSALRMKSGLEPHYELWENISARIPGAIASAKTVKLCGAEAREEERLGTEFRFAYGVYVETHPHRLRLLYLAKRALQPE